LALLAGCGGGSSDSTQTATEGALAAARSGELVSYVQAKARERQQLQARNFGVLPMVGMVAEGAPSAQGGVAAATGVAQSGTTVQEDGVDEDDLIKADGSTIITLVRASSLEVAKPWARVQLHSGLLKLSPLFGSPTLGHRHPNERSHARCGCEAWKTYLIDCLEGGLRSFCVCRLCAVVDRSRQQRANRSTK